jgi:hypothetical protein
MPGEALSPLQLIQTRVELRPDSCNEAKWALHQEELKLWPKSFQLFQGVFAPSMKMGFSPTKNLLPCTLILCACAE